MKTHIFKNFSYEFYDKMEEIINKILEKLDDKYNQDDDLDKLKESTKEYSNIKKVIKRMSNFLKQLYVLNKDEASSYRFTLSYNEINGMSFDIHCVNASYGMKRFFGIKPYSVIMT